MGIFKKISKKFNKAVGLGKGNDLGRIALGIGTGGMSEAARLATGDGGGLTDLLLGKKEGGSSADAIAAQIKATQARGLGELNSALNTPSENIVRTQAETQKKGVLTAAQDARRNAQMNMARTGLKNSSLGMALNRSVDQSTGESVANINANLPGAIRNQQINDAQTRISAGGLANTGNIQHRDIEGRRSGGILGIAGSLAPVAGMVAGGMMGGPVGAMAGQSVGSALAPRPQAPAGAYNPNSYSMGNYQF